ncbi:MAG: hypothetical protein VYE27_05970 [Pseudomonadota bacterium]|nr:hypothetical protein [Pseudomonadota bacterium]
MFLWKKLILKGIFIVLLLTSCQSGSITTEDTDSRNLSSDDGQLDLSRYTLEQQKIEKRDAEALMMEARSKRIVISPDEIEEISSDISLNIAVYARSSTHKVGEKIYRRIKERQDSVDPCIRFKSDDDAQRYFLIKGGPERDIWGLDSDGDGFACDWDPKFFRLIKVYAE